MWNNWIITKTLCDEQVKCEIRFKISTHVVTRQCVIRALHWLYRKKILYNDQAPAGYSVCLLFWLKCKHKHLFTGESTLLLQGTVIPDKELGRSRCNCSTDWWKRKSPDAAGPERGGGDRALNSYVRQLLIQWIECVHLKSAYLQLPVSGKIQGLFLFE